jgi:predicted transcriptional regulator
MTEEIIEQTPDRKYFTILQNILDDMGLSPYAIRLYFRLKRRAGEKGECWENTKHLAEGCNMSKSQVSRSKAELEIAGLITIKKRSLAHGHFPGHIITIVDIWRDNVDYYDNK